MSCITARKCPKCNVDIVCEGNTVYVWGPCCCNATYCPECDYEPFPITKVHISGTPLQFFGVAETTKSPDKVESTLMDALRAYREGKSVWFDIVVHDEQGSAHYRAEPSDFGEMDVLTWRTASGK